MIALSSQTSSTTGAIIIDKYKLAPDSTPTRATRSKTMDTGTVIVNQGCDHGDETYTFMTDVTEAEYTIIDNLQRNGSRVTMATRNGLFSGIIKSKSMRGNQITITFWIEEEL